MLLCIDVGNTNIVLGLYRGEELGTGVRSVTVRLRFRGEERTLTDEEVEATVGAVTRTLQEEMGVELRGLKG